MLMLFINDACKLELLETAELTSYRDYALNEGNDRSPLVARFRANESGHRFCAAASKTRARAIESARVFLSPTFSTWSVGDFPAFPSPASFFIIRFKVPCRSRWSAIRALPPSIADSN